jgi:ferredoxin-NADP reductase/ferredoxin
MPREQSYHPLTVVDVIDETADTRSFVLDVPPALAPSFPYVAGQFCTFRATIGGEDVARCYSMSSSPAMGDPFVVTVKRVPGGKMSNWMNDTLAPGATIDVMPPAGRFVLRPADTPIVAFAGGSGITPVVSIIKTALLTTAREIALVYANRGPASVIFADIIERLRAGSSGRLSVHHHLDSERSSSTRRRARRSLATGRSRLRVRSWAVHDVVQPVWSEGVDRGAVHRAVRRARRRTRRRPGIRDGGSRSARRAEAPHQYEPGDTILQIARRAGLTPPFNCQAGSCATCMAFLEEGTVTMRVNNALGADEVEEGWVLTCQAIPTSREVVVDYDH